MNSQSFCSPNVTGESCGFGTCDVTGKNCVCESGYIHDTVTPIFRNCFLSSTVFLGCVVSALVYAMIVFLWALYERHYTNSKARRLLEIEMGINLSVFIYIVAIWFEKMQSWASFCLYVVFLTLFVEASCRLITVFIDSLAIFSGRNTTLLKQYLIAYRVVFLVTMIVFGTASLAFLQVYQDEVMFNFLFNFHYLSISLISGGLVYVEYRAVQDLIDQVQPSRRAKQFLIKSKSCQKQMMCLTLTCTIVFLLIPSVQFCFKVFPYRFIIWIGSVFSVISMCTVGILFAKRSNKNTRSIASDAVVALSATTSQQKEASGPDAIC